MELRYNPYQLSRKDVFLEVSVWYQPVSGGVRRTSYTIPWQTPTDGAELLQVALASQTDFVQQSWTRVEVCIPNRAAYGNIRPGFIQDTGVLLAVR